MLVAKLYLEFKFSKNFWSSAMWDELGQNFWLHGDDLGSNTNANW
jgi:hypothetical protein